MTEIGRNDLCPCGSGRKYKRCCRDAPKVVAIDDRRDESRPWRRMREAEGRLMPLMLELGVSTWRQRGMDDAYSRFFTDTPVPDDIVRATGTREPVPDVVRAAVCAAAERAQTIERRGTDRRRDATRDGA